MGNPARARLEQLRPPTPQEDHHTAATIQGALSVEQAQELFELLLSQIRKIIFGADDSGRWFDPVESVFGVDASLKSILTGMGYIVPDHLRSNVGEFTVPASVQVGRLVYAIGASTVDHADYLDETTAPAIAIVKDKPTATTATLVFGGRAGGLSGLTPGKGVFLGPDGELIQEGSLPTAPGSVVQRVGAAISATMIIFAPMVPVIL